MVPTKRFDISAVVVLFKRRLDDCVCLSSLAEIVGKEHHGLRLSHIIVYDNSPEFQNAVHLPLGFDYIGDNTNAGVSKAYNCAAANARLLGSNWLLLLDQDTQLRSDFWEKTYTSIADAASDPDVVAIVPRVFDGRRNVSPSRIWFGDIQRPVEARTNGVCLFEITALGSGVLVCLDFLSAIGGFDERYWLDYADRKLFATIWRMKKKVYISEA